MTDPIILFIGNRESIFGRDSTKVRPWEGYKVFSKIQASCPNKHIFSEELNLQGIFRDIKYSCTLATIIFQENSCYSTERKSRTKWIVVRKRKIGCKWVNERQNLPDVYLIPLGCPMKQVNEYNNVLPIILIEHCLLVISL